MNLSSKALLRFILPLLGVFVLLSLVAPRFSRLSDVDFVQWERRHAMIIRDACQIYAAEHSGRFPDAIKVLEGAEYVSTRALSIDLMDRQPPRSWIYHTGLTSDSSPTEWVLLSPPLVNTTATRSERRSRERAGGFQYPPEKPVRVLIRVGGPPESMPEEVFQKLVDGGHIVLPPTAKP